MDTPQHMLMNYSPSMFIYGGVLIMFFGLWVAYNYSNFAFPCLFAGILLATLQMFFFPDHPFLVKNLWQEKQMTLADLEPSALRVITFFHSTKAKRLVLAVAMMFALVILIAWGIFALLFSTTVLRPEDKTFSALLGGILVFSGLGYISVGGTQMGVLYRYALDHWDQIQREYEPMYTAPL